MTFDLQTLYNFRPGRYLCKNCAALLVDAPYPAKGKNATCPVCSVEYVGTDDFSRFNVDAYLEYSDLKLSFDDLLTHCKNLAQIVINPKRPALQMLLDAVAEAKRFVHFSSYGISEFFVGVLKLVAQRVPVRGLVAGIDERTLDEFTAFKADAPFFEVMHFLRGDSWEEFPHQKLVVIDGLLAFTGSANLTLNGWRKAAKGREHVDVITKVDTVVQLHNKLFSPVWATRKEGSARINMSRPPF